MSECLFCAREKMVATSCGVERLRMVGNTFGLVVFGDEVTCSGGPPTQPRCFDCGVFPGGYHHLGCVVAECPRCGEQLVSCDCVYDDHEYMETVTAGPYDRSPLPCWPTTVLDQRQERWDMGALDGRVAIITGAGRGIGREHALLFAAEGAKVVVNDLGGTVDGSGDDRTPAEEVVAEITEKGGQAIPNDDDVADWEGGKRLIDAAIEAFGDLHVLVNNAGILRDRVLFNMTEEDWDSVIHVHLKGHFVPTRHAAAYWRARSKAGEEVRASVINTSSTSGLLGNPGQSNYGAAKAGIAAFTVIAAQELGRYGVRVNALAPAARTRMTESTPGLSDIVRAPGDESQFDTWDPGNISPLVGYLATEDCPATGRVFFVQGGTIRTFQNWTMTDTIDRPSRWTVAELKAEMSRLGV